MPPSTLPSHYRWIAVPLDGSEHALEAVGPAQRLAALHDAALWLVAVAPPGRTAEAEAALTAGQAEVGGTDTRGTVLVGSDPARALADFDDEHPEALLCLTTRGRRPLGRALFGSVGAAVVRHSTQAVALVGPACGRAGDAPVDRLLVCLDGTPEAEVILPSAAAWSDATGVGMVLVHVVYPLVAPEARVAPTDEQMAELAYLRAVAVGLRADGHDVVDVVVQHPHPPEPILGLADDLTGAVVCIATASRGPLVEAVVGSVTAEVLRSSPVPVVVASRGTPVG
jgi:nucleotide-binding universal stress UspA family protein